MTTNKIKLNEQSDFPSIGVPIDGWIPKSETWTRTGNHTFTVSGDVTATYRKGTKVRYKDGGSYEYGVIGSSAYSSPNTTVTLITNTDYTMAAATITDKYLSYSENPEGFPGAFNYTPTHSRTGTNYTNAPTSITATWVAIGNSQAKFSVVWQQNGTPGGTGNQQFTTPVTSTHTLLGSAYNASTNVMQMPQVASATNLCVLTKYDGTTEVTASQFYVCTGVIDY